MNSVEYYNKHLIVYLWEMLDFWDEKRVLGDLGQYLWLCKQILLDYYNVFMGRYPIWINVDNMMIGGTCMPAEISWKRCWVSKYEWCCILQWSESFYSHDEKHFKSTTLCTDLNKCMVFKEVNYLKTLEKWKHS